MDKTSILQLGGTPIADNFKMPDGATLTFVENEKRWPGKDELRDADVILLLREPTEKEIGRLRSLAKAYTVFYEETLNVNDSFALFLAQEMAKPFALADLQQLVEERLPFYYHIHYGEKLGINLFTVAEGFRGKVSWMGNHRLILEGKFGDTFRQVAYWRSNIPLFHGQTLDLYLEYEHSENVEISFRAIQFQSGSISDKVQEWNFGEEDLKDIVRISNPGRDGGIFYTIQAKGEGQLRIGGIHERYSRWDDGTFLPGGERFVADNGEELFCYFDPGDMKPPLNIYFSGYKTKEGFEGFNLMHKKGKPFLLVSDARLEGGAFYLGTPAYEKMVADVLRGYVKRLNFKPGDVILSGLSMGTFGAMYYACDLQPGAVVLGKPLFSLGNVAANEKLNRPGGFPTSVDLLLFLYGSTSKDAQDKLNAKFWDKFDRTEWHKTQFVIAYMYEDDYDMDAYTTLLSHISSSGISVYGKGLHGRHNDDTSGIVEWFNRQYDRVIEEFNNFNEE